MYPASAGSVVAAVVQFIDFSTCLLATGAEIYTSPTGQSATEVEVSTILADLSFVAKHARKELSDGSAGVQTETDQQLSDLCTEIHNIEQVVRSAINSLDVSKLPGTNSSRMYSIQRALVGMLGQWRTDSMLRRLTSLRTRVLTFTVFQLWEHSKESQQREDRFGQLLEEMVGTLQRLESHMDAQARNTGTSNSQIANTMHAFPSGGNNLSKRFIAVLNEQESPQNWSIHAKLVEHFWSRDWSPTPSEPSDTIEDNVDSIEYVAKRRTIVKTLTFDQINVRGEAIPEAFQQTFEWVFLADSARKEEGVSWFSFPEWLQSATNQPYWITGKPGSGKSTLVKFILQHDELRANLRPWAGDVPLVITSYYAWIAGTDLQKSCEGLLRTILCQCLFNSKVAVSTVAPRRWAFLTTLRHPEAQQPPWPVWELEESLDLLLSECKDRIRMAVFIDGLDEFDSAPIQVLELIDRLSSRPGIKICVASREWTEFSDAFYRNPMLRMQELTKPDMAHFAAEQFSSSRAFSEFAKIFPRESKALIKDIVTKAQGVFLWLSVVIRTLLQALSDGEGLSRLHSIVDSLPSDIEDLYSAIWTRIEAKRLPQSASLIRVLQICDGPLHYLTLWLAEDVELLKVEPLMLSQQALSGIEDTIRRRLAKRTMGILELLQNGSVDYLHRTARDWAVKNDARLGALPRNFDPYMFLLKGEAPRFTGASTSHSGMMKFLFKLFKYAAQVADTRDNNRKVATVLDQLERTLKSRHAQTEKDKPGGRCWALLQEGRHLNTIPGLAARYAILPYLKRISKDGSLGRLKLTPTCMSLLENAIFEGNRRGPSLVEGVSAKRRRATVAYLLSQGVSPDQKMVGDVGSLMGNVSEKKASYEDPKHWGEITSLLQRRQTRLRKLKAKASRLFTRDLVHSRR